LLCLPAVLTFLLICIFPCLLQLKKFFSRGYLVIANSIKDKIFAESVQARRGDLGGDGERGEFLTTWATQWVQGQVGHSDFKAYLGSTMSSKMAWAS
jgi:hypothetical protein